MKHIIIASIFILVCLISKNKIPATTLLDNKGVVLLALVVIGVLVTSYLHRYSLLAFVVLNRMGYSFIESFTKSISWNNDVSWCLGVIGECYAKMESQMPKSLSISVSELVKALQDLVNDTYGEIGAWQDVFTIFDFLF